MRILIDCRHLKENSHNGISTFTCELLISLFEENNEHFFYLLTSGIKKQNLFSILKQHGFSKSSLPHFVQTIHIPISNKLLNLFLFFSGFSIELFIKKPIDLFFFPNLNIGSFSKKQKSILVIHDLSFHFFPHFFSWNMNLWHKLTNPKKLIKKATEIVCPSNSTKHDIENVFKKSSKNIHVISHGISSIFTDQKISQKMRKKIGFHIPKQYVLFVGTIEPRKNLSHVIFTVLQARISNPNLRLVIIGSFGWKSKKTKSQIHSKNWIHYYPNIQKKDLPIFYKNASVFLWPTFYEGFGLPVLEALCCNVPVITSFHSSLVEFEQPNLFFINPYFPHESAKIINRLIKNQKTFILQQKSEQILWNSISKKYLSLIKTIENP